MAKIKVFALGGLDERGKNLYVVEVNEKIFVFDVGIRLPEREILGIDIIIPKYTYLKDNRHRIEGIFISKPSDDAFGALPYILKEFSKLKPIHKVLIFTSKLTEFMIRQKLERFRFIDQKEIIIKIIQTNKKMVFGDVTIETFKTTTSIPGSLGFVLSVEEKNPNKKEVSNFKNSKLKEMLDKLTTQLAETERRIKEIEAGNNEREKEFLGGFKKAKEEIEEKITFYNAKVNNVEEVETKKINLNNYQVAPKRLTKTKTKLTQNDSKDNEKKINEVIVYTGDYIFDGEYRNDFTTNLQHLASVCKKEILLLISEATCASRKSFTAPKHRIQNIIEPVLKEAPGRIILACYDQDLYRVSEILNAIHETDSKRKIAVYGATLYDILLKVNDLKSFKIEKSQIINLAETVGTKDTVIIVTGSGERLFIRMNKIAIGNDDFLRLEEHDTVILATPPIPGNELAHAALLDDLARTDVKVINISEKQAWSLNASYEDIKLMVNIMKPKYFLPVKGLYKDFVVARTAAIDAGVEPKKALIRDNGEVITFHNGELKDVNRSSYNPRKQFSDKTNFIMKPTENLIVNGDVYVDGIGVGDIGSIVISERKQLQRDGVLITGVTINRKTKEIVSLIDAQMRGVVYLTNNEEMLKNLQKIIIKVVKKYKINPSFTLNEIKTKMKNDLQDYIKKETGKIPMILTVINEV